MVNIGKLFKDVGELTKIGSKTAGKVETKASVKYGASAVKETASANKVAMQEAPKIGGKVASSSVQLVDTNVMKLSGTVAKSGIVVGGTAVGLTLAGSYALDKAKSAYYKTSGIINQEQQNNVDSDKLKNLQDTIDTINKSPQYFANPNGSGINLTGQLPDSGSVTTPGTSTSSSGSLLPIIAGLVLVGGGIWYFTKKKKHTPSK